MLNKVKRVSHLEWRSGSVSLPFKLSIINLVSFSYNMYDGPAEYYAQFIGNHDCSPVCQTLSGQEAQHHRS